MYKLNQAIQVFSRHSLVLLIEIVDVSIEDFDEEFYRDGSVHACIGDAESTLETFEDTFSIAI